MVDRVQDSSDEATLEASLRPRTLDDYIGQAQTKENLHILIEAARQRAGEWLVELYETWGNAQKAKQWREAIK